jgi:hypothetical protein
MSVNYGSGFATIALLPPMLIVGLVLMAMWVCCAVAAWLCDGEDGDE